MGQDSLFLSKDELRQFTGAIHRKHVCEVLAMKGIRYDVNRKMDVIVLRSSITDFLDPPPGSRLSNRAGKSKSKKLNFDD